MILLWGIDTDEPLARIKRALERRGAPVFFLDQQRVLDTRIELTVDSSVQGRLRVGSAEVALDAITGVYFRPYDVRRMRAVESAGPGSAAEVHAVAVEDAVVCWAEITPALVLNRPSVMASNNSKPYQASLIQHSGFRVPQTLVTTDPEAVREFLGRHGGVIYKSISGIRSIVTRLDGQQESRLANVSNCPTQFQECIEGVDYRVHVVGEKIFACEVISSDADYRYPSSEAPRINACDIPLEIAQRCRALSKVLGLPLTGIDLRKTPSGDWYCFEANPSPGFTFYEDSAGLPIAEAISDLLMSNSLAYNSLHDSLGPHAGRACDRAEYAGI